MDTKDYEIVGMLHVDVDKIHEIQQMKPEPFMREVAAMFSQLVAEVVPRIAEFRELKLPLKQALAFTKFPAARYASYEEQIVDGVVEMVGVGEPISYSALELGIYWHVLVQGRKAPSSL